MQAETSKYVWDATEAARRVLRFTLGKSLDDYVADELLRAAVERQFTILGEALSHVRRVEPAVADRITDLPRAVALRNILVHGYADVDDRIVWGVVIGPLPARLQRWRGCSLGPNGDDVGVERVHAASVQVDRACELAQLRRVEAHAIAPGSARRSTMCAPAPVSAWYCSMLSSTCAGRPRSVMMTGPRRAAFIALLVSWLNSRLDMVVTVTAGPRLPLRYRQGASGCMWTPPTARGMHHAPRTDAYMRFVAAR